MFRSMCLCLVTAWVYSDKGTQGVTFMTISTGGKMTKTYLISWLKVQKIVRKLAVITVPLAQSLPA